MKSEKNTVANPGEILGLSGAFWKSLALHAAVRLRLFTVIGDAVLTGDEAAQRVGGDARGVTTLLNALVGMGLLEKEESRFRNTSAGLLFLVEDSPRYVGYMIRHHANLVDSWGRLDEAVRTGRPVGNRATERAGVLEDFLLGMHSNSMGFAPRAAAEIALGGRRKLLDLGGGPGTWAIQFALANPELCATVFDLPSTRPFAEKTIDSFGVAGQVTFHAGDFTADELPCGHDIAWLSHILHGEDPETCRQIVARAAAALEPGGLIMIHEFILEKDGTTPPFPALFSLNMLSGTDGGRSYTKGELEGMLAAAGATDVKLLPFRGPTESRILAGVIGGD
jgi:hypothetical protein